MEYSTIYLILAGLFGLYMAWGIGANDVANAMATSVGSKALTIKQAILVAAVFEFAGAVLAGGEVTSTIRKGIIDPSLLSGTPELLVYGMLASLLAAGIWLMVASKKGWPVSTTHTIVGAIVGFAAIGIGMDAVKWGKVGTIVMSWVASPLTSGIIAFLLFMSVEKLVLNHKNTVERAKTFVPIYMFLAGFLIALVTILKGLKHVGAMKSLDLSTQQEYMIAAVVGVIVAVIGKFFIDRIQVKQNATEEENSMTVEKIFGILMIITACCMAFAHGSNDVANAIGPVAAIISTVSTGEIGGKSAIPFWVLLLGGGGIVFGLATFGRQVMTTVGEKITHLTPSKGFAAELAAATTIVVASGTGMPISTTHTLVGAVLGVGLARGVKNIDLGIVKRIFVSWIVTIPAGAILSIIFFLIFKAIFS